MVDERPNPDELLQRIQRQEEKARRGRLKVFFGAAAGVGKTYAMLLEAQELRAQGVEVVVGLVETHGRAETEVLLSGLEVLPRQTVEYRGVKLPEFDLDAVLKRRPRLILVDELAHTNVQGSRHPKRWQDIKELLDAGIDVYTTLNVQHLESLNDVVGRIAGVRVFETVPDHVLEAADEVELVDLPPDDLLQRLKEGKVYIPLQAERAIQNFFRKGNLIALRELALRRTADRVDAQMRQYREDWLIEEAWQVKERLLVCIGADTQAERIVRGGRRLANALRAEWVVVYVETPRLQRLPEAERARILATLRLAEELGAETVTLAGHYVGEEILTYAHTRNATKIVLGKPSTPKWWRWLFSSAVEYIVRNSADIDVLFISGDTPGSDFLARTKQHPIFLKTREYLSLPAEKDRKELRHRLGYVWSVAVTLLCTLLARLTFPYFELSNLIMLYLLGVIFVAYRFGRGPSVLSAILSVAAFDFFYVQPYLTFAVSDTQYLVTFAVMLAVALVISGLTSSIQLQAAIASYRERRTAALYAMSRELAATRGEENILRIGVKHLYEVFDSPAVILLPDEQGRIAYPKSKSIYGSLHGTDLSIAQWVYDHGEMAGFGTDTLPGSDMIYLPLIGSSGTLGVLAMLPTDTRRVLLPEQQRLLQTFADQIALALERARLADQAQEAQVRMETEHLRNFLLSTIAHDLRTPLAAIIGAVGLLIDKHYKLAEETREEAGHTIREEALRMNRLVNNVLDMARLQAGAVTLNRQWQTLEELVGSALRELDAQLAKHRVITRLPTELPLIYVDGLLIERVLANLLENAVKYTPPESRIEITAEDSREGVIVTVSDNGPGLAPGEEGQVFEKFYRAHPEGGVIGAGLGLPICRAIIEAHGGRIWAENKPEGSAVFRFLIPRSGSPPVMGSEPAEMAAAEEAREQING